MTTLAQIERDKATAENTELKTTLAEIERIANIAPADNRYGSLAVRMNKIWLLARGNKK